MRVFLIFMISIYSVAGARTWQVAKQKDGVTVYTSKEKHEGFLAIRGETIVNDNIFRVISTMTDTERAPEWTPNLYEAKTIKEISAVERIQYNKIAAFWPISDRLFVTKGKLVLDFENDRAIVKIQSIDYPGLEQENLVIGHIQESQFTITAVGPGKEHSHVMVEILTDPGGWLPSWIVNFAQKSWPIQYFGALRDQLKKKDVVINSKINEILKSRNTSVSKLKKRNN